MEQRPTETAEHPAALVDARAEGRLPGRQQEMDAEAGLVGGAQLSKHLAARTPAPAHRLSKCVKERCDVTVPDDR